MAKESGFNLKLKMNSAQKIIKDHGLDEDGKATEFLRNEVDRFCDPYIPFGMGSGVHMKSNKTYPSNHEIKYIAPYSHYHYKGKQYISPKLGVSGILLKSDRWWSPKGEKKMPTDKDMNYQGAPKRRPRMG